MIEEIVRLARILDDAFPGGPPAERDVRKVLALSRILAGEPSETVCSELKLQLRGIKALVEDANARGLCALAPVDELTTTEELIRRRLGIAQMLLGTLAERRFEEISDEITGGKVLQIEDHRPSRSDTDYRVLNGGGRPVCRLNIKFHGTPFRQAKEYVGLEPEDCFALATYKINNAIKRQEQDGLPFVFLVLSVLDLSAGDVGKLVPEDYVWALAVMAGKRVVEEAIVDRLRSDDHRHLFRPIIAKMPEGQFRIISAAKTYKLLQSKLFERVHALTYKSFTRRFRNAEVDMHLSLSGELTPIRTFLEMIVKESPQKFAVRLYRGDY